MKKVIVAFSRQLKPSDLDDVRQKLDAWLARPDDPFVVIGEATVATIEVEDDVTVEDEPAP